MNSRLKKIVVLFLTFSTVITLPGCNKAVATNDTVMTSEDAIEESKEDVAQEVSVDTAASEKKETGTVKALSRKSFIEKDVKSYADSTLVPTVEPYEIEADLSNCINAYDFEYWTDEAKAQLAEDGFLVTGDSAKEFFFEYEVNRYAQRPDFVTVDSLLHTYHLYFQHLLKQIEKDSLNDMIKSVSDSMLTESIKQYNELKGSEWEAAAVNNVSFFAVGASLIRGEKNAAGVLTLEDEECLNIANTELERIYAHKDIMINEINGYNEDYSQYIPRGYYEGDASLAQYFRTMMWYGRINFQCDNTDANRSALLMNLALNNADFNSWEGVYEITSFFAGASDDNGYYEYMPIIEETYKEAAGSITADSLIENNQAFEQYSEAVAKLDKPAIASIPVWENEENVIPGFRFMGQRFSIDAAAMQKLVYRSIEETKEGERRMLPDVLDVAAVLGSDKAKDILVERGEDRYPNYTETLDKLRTAADEADDNIWNASLYSSWLNTLRPLLDKKGEGYPFFMQNEKWACKCLETFAGSYAELKHDTVLYSKQMMAEMGGGEEEEIDDRGYVEPEPEVYSRFVILAESTIKGLEEYNMISKANKEGLENLAQIARELLSISEKELRNELPTDEEFDLIRSYGGNIEHIWYDIFREETGQEYPSFEEYPAALVVDIATDPNGIVREIANANPSEIYVVVPVEGKLRVAKGTVFNFYQFDVDINERMTDSKWRQEMGIELDGNGEYNYDNCDNYSKPDFTLSYRMNKVYNW